MANPLMLANPVMMAAMPLLEFGAKLLERWFPDPQKKAEAELEIFKLMQAGEFQSALAQMQVNAKEAEHSSIFVAGWRPFVGWVCGVAFLYSTVLFNLLAWYARAKGWPAPPTLDSDLMMYVLGGMLGLGGLRSYEKKVGVAK